jgi:hypothetical protein
MINRMIKPCDAPPSAMQIMGDHCGAGTRQSIW